MTIYYTDGSASPNPGPGGYAVLDKDGNPKALGSEKHSTNIRMEAMAILEAIKLSEGNPCQIFTDSQFWINVLTEWAPGWEKRGWTKKNGEIKNLELVKQLFSEYQNSKATLIWVRGHNNHELNDLADSWANRARKGETIEGVNEKSID